MDADDRSSPWINGDGSPYAARRRFDPRHHRRYSLFRLVDGFWQRVHRHADPLVDRHDVPDMVQLRS
jgi:hypothetical protein